MPELGRRRDGPGGLRRRALGAVLVVAGLLGAGFAWTGARAAPAGDRAAPTPTDTGMAAPFTLGPLSDYADMVTRPLFSPQRRPPASMPASSRTSYAPAAVQRGRFKLAGVVILGETRYALLKHESDRDFVRIEEGQTIHDWMVTAIRPGEVVLDRRGVRDIVQLSANKMPALDKRKAARRKALAKNKIAKARRRAAQRQRDNYVRRLRPDEIEQSRRLRNNATVTPRLVPQSRGALNRAEER